MTDPVQIQFWQLVVAAIVAVITLVGFLLMIKQFKLAGLQLQLAGSQLEKIQETHRQNHDWERRIAAQSAVNEYSSVVDTKDLKSEFDYLNRTDVIPLAELQGAFERCSDMQGSLNKMLNYYERLARGVRQGIYDEELIKAARLTAMKKVLRVFGPYIEHRRKEFSPNAWADLDALVDEWKVQGQLHARRPTADQQV